MTTYLSNYGMYTVGNNVITEVDINLRSNSLNYATFMCPYYIPQGTIITIRYGMTKDVFTGKVSQCRKTNRTISGNTIYDIEIVELADELSNFYITDTTYTGIYINNLGGTSSKTLGWYVQQILNRVGNSGWTDNSDAQFKDQTSPPGGTTGSKIPSMGFSTCTVMTALNRLIVNIFNYGLWFDYEKNGEYKRIRYGEYRSDIREFPTPINISMVENSVNHNVDGVIVYGESNDLCVTHGNVAHGKRTVAYRYNGCNSMDELRWVAQRIYDQRKVPQIRYEIQFPCEYFDVHEGDRIFIFDETVGLHESATGYGVKDVRIKNDSIVVGIGASTMTIFDILNDRLSIIDGNILSFQPLPIDTGWNNVFASSTSAFIGPTTEISVTIEGQTFLGDYQITPIIGGEQIEGAGFMRIYAVAAYNEPTVTITSAEAITINGSNSFLEEWFPWSFKWADIEVKYIFDPDLTAEGASIDWTMTWGNASNADLYTVDNGQVMDYGGYNTSSSQQSTLMHKWYVTEKVNAPHSYPLITATCAGTTTTATIKDVLVRVAVFYDASGTYPPLETTMATGEIQMRIVYGPTAEQSYTDWITIYNSASADLYINKTYDGVDDLGLDYTVFGTGEHHVQYQMYGTNQEGGLASASVYLTGSYNAFDEKTEVVQ